MPVQYIPTSSPVASGKIVAESRLATRDGFPARGAEARELLPGHQRPPTFFATILTAVGGDVLKVGLTGNIASGKSSVASIWARLGARVIDADQLSRRAVQPGSDALRSIVDFWGERVLRSDGTLDRAVLRDLAFRDPAARARLEAIVHPEVARLRDLELAAARASGERIVVADIPLLFEVGLQNEFDLVVLVDSPEITRLERLVKLRGLAPSEAGRMVDAQMPSDAKRAAADLVIVNDAGRAELEERASEVWREIEARARLHDGPG